MRQTVFLPALKLAWPAVAGAVGGIVAATYPAVHSAFCSAGF